jgi:hypothetical protein
VTGSTAALTAIADDPIHTFQRPDATGAALDLPPDFSERSLNATIVLRWEYRPGSFATIVWTRRQDAVETGRVSLAGALRGFGAADADDVFLVKTSVHIGR